jgi:putative flippase GtrA
MERVVPFIKTLAGRRFVRYLLVGGTTFAIDFILFSVLHSLLGWDVLLANTVSYWSSIAFNFSVNYKWTFGGTETTAFKRQLGLYLLLLMFNFGFSSIFLSITIGTGLNPQIAKIIATGLQMIWTYIAYKKVVFT